VSAVAVDVDVVIVQFDPAVFKNSEDVDELHWVQLPEASVAKQPLPKVGSLDKL